MKSINKTQDQNTFFRILIYEGKLPAEKEEFKGRRKCLWSQEHWT